MVNASRTQVGLPFVQKLSERLGDVSVTSKRKPGQEVHIEAWYPYYAGYTEEFVETVIDAANLPPRSHVLDPWNGCGTTTRVADSLGHTALGLDINPVATLVASAKLARPGDALHITGFAKRVAACSVLEQNKASQTDPLRKWLCPKLVSTFRSIEHHILSDLAVRDGDVLNPAIDALPPLASFLLFALQRAARRFAGIKAASNPTWLRPKKRPPRHEPTMLADSWLDMVRAMARDLDAAASDHHGPGSEARLGDSRELGLPESSVDLVVTSPPYCTRIDYVISTSFELATLGVREKGERFDDLRRESMGTPLARRMTPAGASDFPDGVATVLQAIREHPSKSSKSYYYKTYAQYFTDALASLEQLQQVLKPGASAILVVQSSYYKDVYVDLPELYLDMAQSVGMEAAIAAEFDVTKFLAQINTRSTAHRSSTTHRESVLVLEAA